MGSLPDLVAGEEQWLVERVLLYAGSSAYADRVPRLAEAWRISIRHLSALLVQRAADHQTADGWDADPDLASSTLASYGLFEARRHHAAGVGLDGFLGMMAHFRRAYMDLIDERESDAPSARRYRLLVNRAFDAVELGFCREWAVLTREVYPPE